MNVIKKTITDSSTGHDNEIWQANLIYGSIDDGSLMITLNGWKDQTAYESGKASATQKTIRLQIGELVQFDAIWAEIVSKIIDGDIFANAEVISATKPTPQDPAIN